MKREAFSSSSAWLPRSIVSTLAGCGETIWPSTMVTRSNGAPDGVSRPGSAWITNVPLSCSITCTLLRVRNDVSSATIAAATVSIQRAIAALMPPSPFIGS